jgi:hypothetical protein
VTGWQAIKDGSWLDPARARGYRRLLAILPVLAAAAWLAASHGGVDPAGKPVGTDFLSFWAAAGLAAGGHALDAYRPAMHHAAEIAAFGRDTGYYAFFYPPPFLLLCLPLGFLPYFGALVLWLGTSGLALWAALRRAFGRWPGGVAALVGFPPMLINLGHGQNGFLSATLLGAGLLLVPARPLLAGMLLGSLVVKPHLALLVPLALAARGAWRSILMAAATAGAWCLAASLIFGPACWRAFLDVAPLARATLEQGLVEPYKMVSPFAAVRLAGGEVALAWTVQAAMSAMVASSVVVLAWRRCDPAAQAVATIAATLVASPFLLDYDLTLMAFPLAWMANQGLRRGFLPWERSLLALVYLAPLGGRSLAMTCGLPVDLLASACLWGLACRRALGPGAPVQSIAMPPLTCSVCPVT